MAKKKKKVKAKITKAKSAKASAVGAGRIQTRRASRVTAATKQKARYSGGR